jgi:hypothetical protein
MIPISIEVLRVSSKFTRVGSDVSLLDFPWDPPVNDYVESACETDDLSDPL